jgi:hypothetical protein
MTKNKMTIRQQLEKYLNGEKFECHNFYDWFCRKTSLEKKSNNLFKKLNSISKSSKFDIDKTYSYFKNNCMFNSPNFDEIVIGNIESGVSIYNISCRYGKYELYGNENNFNYPLVNGKWSDIKEFFN